MSLILYHGRASTCSKKVRLALYEKGVGFESRLLDLARQEQKAPDYIALNRKGVVPTLVHDGYPIVESSVILEYVEEALPGPPLAPEDPRDRAAMRLWLRFSDESAYPAIAGPTWKYMQDLAASRSASSASSAAPPKPRYSDADLAEADVRMADCVAALERALSDREWLLGEHFTLADAAILPFAVRIRNLRPGIVEAARQPAVTAWLERAALRSSFDRAMNFIDDPRAADMPNI